MTTIVKCPNCQRPVPWVPESKYRPFCSERCRLIDLGEWIDEKHKISEPIADAQGGSWLDADSNGGGEREH
jgi:uncharacterized protein